MTEWIKSDTSPDARFLSFSPPTLYLHAGRKSVPIRFMKTEAKMHEYLLNERVDWIVLDCVYSQYSLDAFFPTLSTVIDNNPTEFPTVYEKNGSVIYRATKKPGP